MSVPSVSRLASQSGAAFELARGARLEVIDPLGRQVADVALFARADVRETFSAGRTLDYNERIYLSTGDALYSNRSRPMMRIESDTVGRHDYLLSPCSERMFELLRGERRHPSCLGFLAGNLNPFGIDEDAIGATFNAFMNVEVAVDGRITIRPPRSGPGDRIVLRAEMDLIVGLTACSSEFTNAGSCKPIDYRILAPAAPEGAVSSGDAEPVAHGHGNAASGSSQPSG